MGRIPDLPVNRTISDIVSELRRPDIGVDTAWYKVGPSEAHGINFTSLWENVVGATNPPTGWYLADDGEGRLRGLIKPTGGEGITDSYTGSEVFTLPPELRPQYAETFVVNINEDSHVSLSHIKFRTFSDSNQTSDVIPDSAKWAKLRVESISTPYFVKNFDPLDEIFVTFVLWVPTDFADWAGLSEQIVQIQDIFGLGEALEFDYDNSANLYSAAAAQGLAGSTPSVETPTFIRGHLKISDDILIWDLGSLGVYDFSGGGYLSSNTGFNGVQFIRPGEGDTQYQYITSVSVGTTGPDSVNIFYDDFSTGDFSHWDYVNGTPTIVNTPGT